MEANLADRIRNRFRGVRVVNPVVSLENRCKRCLAPLVRVEWRGLHLLSCDQCGAGKQARLWGELAEKARALKREMKFEGDDE